MTDSERLDRMREDLRTMRNKCEPKTRENHRYYQFSVAVTALNWLINDLKAEGD